jgi:hypothetical protein
LRIEFRDRTISFFRFFIHNKHTMNSYTASTASTPSTAEPSPNPPTFPAVTIISTGLLFDPGRIVGTPNALDLLKRSGYSVGLLLNRHLHGDFGDLDAHDLQQNLDAVEHGDRRIFSVYRLVPPNVLRATPVAKRNELDTVWIITEWNRSVTTVLCPHDY